MSLFSDAKLILTPNGYKDGKIYALKPFDGSGDFTMVRATGATRVNSAGLIESVGNNIARLDYTENSCPCILIEPQRTNLFLHSENFADSYWAKTRINIASNQIISLDGTLTGDLLTQQLGETNRGFVGRNLTATGNLTYSIFAKKKEKDFLIMTDNASGLGFINTWFNLSNGTTGTVDSTRTAKIINYGNGWYKCSVTVENTSSTIQCLYGLGDIDNSTVVVDSGGIYIWGAQLEQGTEATSYIPTTTTTATRNADVATVTPPIGTTEIIETFEDNSVNVITTIPSTYQLPIGRIKHIVMK